MEDIKTVYEIRFIKKSSVPKATVCVGDIDKFLQKLQNMGILVTECKPIIKKGVMKNDNELLPAMPKGSGVSQN